MFCDLRSIIIDWYSHNGGFAVQVVVCGAGVILFKIRLLGVNEKLLTQHGLNNGLGLRIRVRAKD